MKSIAGWVPVANRGGAELSYTVVIDEREREQRFENRLNVLFRHCRIGRIQRKVQILGGALVPSGVWSQPLQPVWPVQKRVFAK